MNMLRNRKGLLQNGSEFPVSFGMDFSGVVAGTGQAVPQSRFKIGDEVRNIESSIDTISIIM